MSVAATAKSVCRTVAISACVALFVPTSVCAQLKPEAPIGSRIPVDPEVVEVREAGIIKKGFAQCIYRASPSASAALLLHSDPLNSDFAAAKIKNISNTFDMSVCLGAQAGVNQSALGFRFQREMLRALLSEEAYLAGHRAAPTLAPDAVESVARTYVTQGDALLRAKAIAAFSDCVVFSDVAHADALLRTMPASPGERTAARALAPALGGCIPQGDQVLLTPKNVRAFVADGMWHRFSRSRAPALAAKMKS